MNQPAELPVRPEKLLLLTQFWLILPFTPMVFYSQWYKTSKLWAVPRCFTGILSPVLHKGTTLRSALFFSSNFWNRAKCSFIHTSSYIFFSVFRNISCDSAVRSAQAFTGHSHSGNLCLCPLLRQAIWTGHCVATRSNKPLSWPLLTSSTRTIVENDVC